MEDAGREKDMGYIRERRELRTGYQEIENWKPELDLQCDFVMTYGLDDTLKQRIACFREKGYEVHLMTGCAWGSYGDYLTGAWDGKEHWEECQTDRNGEKILHGVNIPYMVPTLTFVDYLTEKLCRLVDQGISAIHMEEPEFWDAGGYSPAFHQEYEAYYKEPWKAPHTSVNARYRCSVLKAYLYARLIDQLSRKVKAYSKDVYGSEVGFYVATHSLVNYTQWKIMSPGSRLVDMEHVDGFIAQVWSGTSGTGNVYEGHYKSRTFETAFLEYGIMQEMIRNTDKMMWFLHDPVEDFPENGWEVYRKKYIKTMTASLLWPEVDHYEVCPWPNRVFNGRYPKKLGMADGMIPTTDMDGAKDIPAEYATMLCGMIQLLGDMKQEKCTFWGNEHPVGILMSDTSLFERSLPDYVDVPVEGSIVPADSRVEADGKKIVAMQGKEEAINGRIISLRESGQEKDLYEEIQKDQGKLYEYAASCAYPQFFGLSMPLLKNGLFVQPVCLEHVKRYEDYLKAYRYLILSYEYMKPDTPLYNEAIAAWVRQGGCLIYIGDGSDPYHSINAWWNENSMNYRDPSEHLFELLGLSRKGLLRRPENGTYPAGEGRVSVWNAAPALLTTDEAYAKEYRKVVKQALFEAGYLWKETNSLTMERGPYRIISVMDESISSACCTAEGLFTDLLTDGYPVVHRISIPAGSEGLLFDYSKIEGEELRIIATAARIEKLECSRDTFEVWEKAADRIHVYTRIRLPWKPSKVTAVDEAGELVEAVLTWEEETNTVLISYDSRNKLVKLTGCRETNQAGFCE